MRKLILTVALLLSAHTYSQTLCIEANFKNLEEQNVDATDNFNFLTDDIVDACDFTLGASQCSKAYIYKNRMDSVLETNKEMTTDLKNLLNKWDQVYESCVGNRQSRAADGFNTVVRMYNKLVVEDSEHNNQIAACMAKIAKLTKFCNN